MNLMNSPFTHPPQANLSRECLTVTIDIKKNDPLSKGDFFI